MLALVSWIRPVARFFQMPVSTSSRRVRSDESMPRPTLKLSPTATVGTSPQLSEGAASAEAPNTVSEPNQVANSADDPRRSGRLRPASIKSLEFRTLRDARNPTRIVRIR